MELLLTVINLLKSSVTWIFRKCGYKIVKSDDYKDEIMEVDLDYPSKSIKCIEETKDRAKFYWSEKQNLGYEKYFEIEGNARKYFMCRKQILWIKRSK